MWSNKNKAVTFSFDDGIIQDKKVIEILNKYNLKGTFNLNSALLGLKGKVAFRGAKASHDRIAACDVKRVYEGQEVAAHTLTHASLTELDDDTIAYQVEKDRLILSELCGYEVVGMAYPYGAADDRVVNIIKNKTRIMYARTSARTDELGVPQNLFGFNPNVRYIEENRFYDMAQRFLSAPENEKSLLYIWGHSYEMDLNLISWEKFEEFCKYISKRTEIFYGTNKEVFGL